MSVKQDKPKVKLWLHVDLDGFATDAQLTKLAQKLREQHHGDRYARMFISYTLPSQASGYYAHTDWDPAFELRYQGFSYRAALNALREFRESVPGGAKILGVWEWWMTSQVLVMIYESSGRWYLATNLMGAMSQSELEKRGPWYWDTTSTFEERYRIMSNGQLEFRDKLGAPSLATSLLSDGQ